MINSTKAKILKKLWYLLEKYPYLRVGQLISNAIKCELGSLDIFYVEDKALLKALENYPKNLEPDYISVYSNYSSNSKITYTSSNRSWCCNSELIPKIITNKAKCLICNEILESKDIHDYKICKCGNLSIDGGKYYLKRSANNPDKVEELSIVKYICFKCGREQ